MRAGARVAASTNGPLAPRDPRCDELPDVFAAEPGRETGYYCQDIAWSCANGDWNFTWADQPVGIDEEGDVTFRYAD